MSTHTVRWSILLFAGLILPWHAALGRTAGAPPEKAPQADPEQLREKTVYIPYDKLRETFEREGRGVFLPYEEFQELWQAAAERTRKPPDPRPPIEALVSEVTSDATVSRDVVEVRATVSIEVLTDGWHQVPLRLSDAAVTSAVIAGQPARLVTGPDGGHRLLVEKKSKEPERIELTLVYAKAFTKSSGRNSVSLDAPQAPVNRWRVRIPEAGVKIDIHPLIAATQVPNDGAAPARKDETEVLAFVGAAPSVRIDWTPRAEGATGLKALVSVQAVQRMWIHEGVVRSNVQLTYDIRRGALERLIVEVPADQKVVNVFDANIRQWSVEPAGDSQRINAELFEPSQGTQEMAVELERFSEFSGAGELKVPVIRAVGVGRQQGVVGIGVAEGLRAEPIRWTGLLQMDAAEMPKPPAGGAAAGPWALSYRFASVPYDLALRVGKIEPRITVDAFADMRLEPQEIVSELQAIYTIEKAGVFGLEFELPQGYALRSVRGFSAADVEPAAVESSQVSADNKTRLTVNLSRRAFGRVGCTVTVHRSLDEPDLLIPTGKTVDVAVAVPRAVGRFLERTAGRFILRTPESLRVSPLKAEGLRSISVAEALADIIDASKPATAEGALAFSFAGEPVSLVLQVERRKPYVTARQFLLAKIESGVVKYEATFLYDIRYSDVESLRIDVPSDLVGRIHCDTKGVRESVVGPTPKDTEEGYAALRLRGEAKFTRDATVKFSWEAKLDSLEVGESRDILVPRLKPMDVDRAWGQIALAKAETIDLRTSGGAASPTPTGLRPIDPRHDLMDGAAGLGAGEAARAFEFHDDWALVVTATRYKLEEVKRTSIERALLRIVVTRGDRLSVQALYRIRSAHQRLALQLPTAVSFDTDPVRVNGRPVSLERGKTDEFFVPLKGQNPDSPFVLEVRYTLPQGGARLGFPVFPSEPAVQKVCLTVYLPPERVFLGSTGPWTDEQRWDGRDWQGFLPTPKTHEAALAQWVTDGVLLPANPTETFQVDGRPYLFSALQPAAPPEGMLSLVTIDEDWWNAIVVAVLLVSGVVLLHVASGTRFIGVGAFLSGCVLCGVFLPTFSMQILNVVTGCAIIVVLLVWLVHHLVWVRPRDPAVLARKRAREDVRLARIRAQMPQPAAVTSVSVQIEGGERHG